MTKPREICVNLNAAEASAFANGATALIRPSALRVGNVASARSDLRGMWGTGDVLILREAWVFYDWYMFPAGSDYDGPVEPSSRLPAFAARHRYPVLSVRVCQLHAVTAREKADAGWRPAGWVRARPDGNLDGDAWVSVTTVNRAPAPGEGSKT